MESEEGEEEKKRRRKESRKPRDLEDRGVPGHEKTPGELESTNKTKANTHSPEQGKESGATHAPTISLGYPFRWIMFVGRSCFVPSFCSIEREGDKKSRALEEKKETCCGPRKRDGVSQRLF